MRTRTAALALAVALATAALAAEEAQRRSWIDHVRFHTLRSLKAVGREIRSAVASMRTGMTSLRDGAAKGLSDVTREGRRGLAHASKAVSQAATRAFRETHDTFLASARTVTTGVATEEEPRGPAAAARKIDSPILAPHFLRGHDILLAWHLDTGGRPIRASALFEDRLLVETVDHDLYSFEPRTGILQWLYALPGASQGGYSGDENNIFVIAKDTYIELDRIIGRPRHRIILPFPASNPPTVFGNLVLINSWERRIYALERATRAREWTFSPDDNVLGAVVATPEIVYIADVAGNLVAYSIAARRASWTYKAHDAFRVTPVLCVNDVVLPADDLFVHSVHRFSGLPRWKYAVQGPITQPIWADGDTLYFSADGDAFYAVGRGEGNLLWRSPKGGWPVAVGRDHLYIRGAGKEVWCLDPKTGDKKWAVSAEPFTHFVRNTATDHIYLCTNRGEVYAFYLRGDHQEKKAPAPVEPKPAPGLPGIEEPGGPVAPRPVLPAPAPEAPAPPAPAPPAPKEAEEEDEVPPAAKGIE